MEYRTLGKTGLEVSVVSFGAASLGSVYRKINESEGLRAVHLAIELGMNFIDVSPYYGITLAETVLGKALKEIPRDKYYLATKVGRYGDDEFDFSAKRVTESVDESLRRLNVDYIDIIQCHDIEFVSLDQILNESLPALRKVQEQGKVGFVGITCLPMKAFRYVLERAEVDTILSYCHYALNDSALEGLIPLLEEKNVGIINASALSMGLLTQRGIPDWHPADDETKAICAKATAYCNSKGVDISQVAMQFALANPRVHTTLLGTASPENLKKNLKWMESPMDQQLLAEVLEILKPIHNKTWSEGRPENN